MTTLALTVIGDDRAGLVSALAEIVTAHDGNWEESRLAELAGKFAGIVVVSVPPDNVKAFEKALKGLGDQLDVAVHEVAEEAHGAAPEDAERVSLEIMGQDHPGIVSAVASIFARHGVSVEELSTEVRDAPMFGGTLFDAKARLAIPGNVDLAAVRTDIEAIAHEIFVDATFEDATIGE